MKTSYLSVLLAALALSGCSQNEITEMSPEANPAVGFSVYTGVQTRGVVTDLALLKKDPATTDGTTKGGGFGILAYYTGQEAWTTNTANHKPNFMYNQQVKWGSSWEYAPLKYWPNTAGDKITFFAYGPYDNTSIDNGIELSGNTAGDYPTLTFTVKGTETSAEEVTVSNDSKKANSMIDLVVADLEDKEKTTENIKFQFAHILSRANFQARLDKNLTSGNKGDGKTYVCITGARIVGSTTNSSSKFYGKATYKWATAGESKWDYTTTTIPTDNYDLKDILSLVNHSSIEGDALNGKSYTTESVVLKQDGSAKNLFNRNDVDSKTADEYLFLIPPTDGTDTEIAATTGGITSEKDIEVQIDYDIITLDEALSNNTSEKFSKTSTTATVSLPSGTLKRGKAYNYIFTIGLEGIKVDADVTAWGTDVEAYAPSTDVTIESGNVSDATAVATAIKTAITTMNTAKEQNPNCDYFVINIAGAVSTSGGITLTDATDTKFVVGDQIELNFKGTVTTGTITAPANWTAGAALTSSAGKVILQKNPTPAKSE